MASTAAQTAALGNDGQFQVRVRSLVLAQAGVVYAESNESPLNARRKYASYILSNPDAAQRVAVVIAARPNLVAQTTAYDFVSGHITTDATDAQIASQIASDWSMLAGA